MKHLYAAGAALFMALGAVLSGEAWAADLEEVISSSDWSGFYFGAHVGTGDVDVNGSYLADDVEFGLEPTDPFVGVQAGYNWQIERLVMGIQGDVSLAEWDDEKGPNSFGQFVSADLDWLATLRTRLGWAADRFLLFGTIGAAWANGEFTGIGDVTAVPQDKDKVNFNDLGLVAGGGVEWAFAKRWSWKLEGLWLNFNESLDITNLTTNSDPSDRAKYGDAWLVWTGINFRFR